MNEAPYTNRELDRMFNTLEDRNGERHIDILKELAAIKVQTTKTNGSVINLKIWRGILTGGFTVVILLVIPLIVYAFNLATNKQ